jgi:cytochrome bd-type quinol oxidase subunit 2
MRLIQKLSSSILLRRQTLLEIISLLAVFGSLLEITGGIWDATSHILREPELFWTIQHVAVYTGVAMIAISGILGAIFLITKKVDGNLKRGLQIIIIGSALQVSAGYADSLSHDLFGIDGLVSWSHQPLEIGLLLSALGGFLIMTVIKNQKFKKLLPVSILTLIFSISWLGFNLNLIFASPVLCTLVYEIFSSGCAVL